MTYPPELEQAVAERLFQAFLGDGGLVERVGPAWIDVAREALALRDEAMMEAARKVSEYHKRMVHERWNVECSCGLFDDAALRKIIGLEGEEEG